MTNARGRFSVVEKIAAGELFRGDSTTRAPFPKQRFEDGFGYSDFRRRVAAHRTFRKGVTAWKYVTAPKHKKVENMKEGKWENGFFGQDDSPGTVIIRMRRAGIEAPKGAFVFNASHLYRRTYFVKPVNCSAAHGWLQALCKCCTSGADWATIALWPTGPMGGLR